MIIITNIIPKTDAMMTVILSLLIFTTVGCDVNKTSSSYIQKENNKRLTLESTKVTVVIKSYTVLTISRVILVF
ncbi:hypothetical protein LSH36_1947g00005 [Paralvinella palmiformis]|uniref:Uncharacterized protein n=1 Tax=Paralvinella palmiformis TaxID=53620 RepID=A0AAD9IQW3_9ANNE|nr:hypothetical protein LSH36_1947g00005 [Paralvinella palmiformis]